MTSDLDVIRVKISHVLSKLVRQFSVFVKPLLDAFTHLILKLGVFTHVASIYANLLEQKKAFA